jgi:hypothetical protein
MTTNTAQIAIRRATESDRPTLHRLAALDSSRTPSGEVLIAEVDGEPQAAIEIAGGAVVADPFRPTAHVVELLGLRAARMRRPAESRLRLRLRAYRTA